MTPEQEAMLRRVEIRLELNELARVISASEHALLSLSDTNPSVHVGGGILGKRLEASIEAAKQHWRKSAVLLRQRAEDWKSKYRLLETELQQLGGEIYP